MSREPMGLLSRANECDAALPYTYCVPFEHDAGRLYWDKPCRKKKKV